MALHEIYLKGKGEKLMNKIIKMLNKGYVKVQESVNGFAKDEKGASELVVVVGLIVITLALVVIFRGQLTNIINAVGTKVMNWINAN